MTGRVTGRHGSRQLTVAGACGWLALLHPVSVDQEVGSGQEVGPDYKSPPQ